MRRTLSFSVLAAAVLLLCAFDRSWKPFVNKSANFAVMMPGPPAQARTIEDTAAGPIGLYQASVVSATKGYVVSYSDLPPAMWRVDPRVMLADARDGAARRVGGRIVRDRELELAGEHPGREFAITVKDRLELTQRVYLVGHRLYQINMGCVPGGCTRGEVQAYLDSFRLLAPPAG